MKSALFSTAIMKRNRIRFLYDLNEVIIDPYYISQERSGKKVIYGKTHNSNEVRKYEYFRISNIKVIESIKFSPVIPIIS